MSPETRYTELREKGSKQPDQSSGLIEVIYLYIYSEPTGLNLREVPSRGTKARLERRKSKRAALPRHSVQSIWLFDGVVRMLSSATWSQRGTLQLNIRESTKEI